MPTQEERDALIARIVKMLYEARANRWSVQDKGVLMAAIKLQLQEKERQAYTR